MFKWIKTRIEALREQIDDRRLSPKNIIYIQDNIRDLVDVQAEAKEYLRQEREWERKNASTK